MSKKAKMPTIATSNDPRWAAVVARAPKADGRFFYAVKTTGVYCRPSCGARTANPENVEFYLTTREAERAGYRPCKRCKPEQPALRQRHTLLIADLCRLLEHAAEPLQLQDLARHAGMSPYHLHRLFKAVTGLTPRAYAVAHQAKRVRALLERCDTVTEAIYQAGYSSQSRFYEQSNQLLGMTPSNFRASGAHAEIRFAIGECSLGSILVAMSGRGICAILLGDDPEALVRDLQDKFSRACLIGGDAKFEQLVGQVVAFVEAPRLGLDLPLDVRGTAFQQRVWQALREIPVGERASYAEIAKRIGAPKSIRGVANACAANTLAVAIPCHRVVRSDGGLAGYRWGIERKRALLDLEAER